MMEAKKIMERDDEGIAVELGRKEREGTKGRERGVGKGKQWKVRNRMEEDRKGR